LAANGDLTDAKHDEFWADFKGMSDVDSQLLLSHIRDVAPALQKYQKALWQSAKISLSAFKPIRTKELDIAWAKLQKITPDADAQAEAEEKKRTGVLFSFYLEVLFYFDYFIIIDIYDMFGKLIRTENIQNKKGDQIAKINTEGSLANGIYLVNVHVNGQLLQQKVIIQ